MRYNLYNKPNQFITDALIVGAAFFLSYQIRYAGQVPASDGLQFWILLLPVMLGRLATNVLAGVYRFKWRYVSSSDAIHITRAYGAFSFILLLLRLGSPAQWSVLRIPIGVIATEFLISLQGALAVRLLRRILYERKSSRIEVGQKARRLLLVGAGSHGATVAKEMALHKGIRVVGFLDDDPLKSGAVVTGVPVLGPTSRLSEIINEKAVDEVFLCIPPAARKALNLDQFVPFSKGAPVRSRIAPSVDEILDTEDSPVIVRTTTTNRGVVARRTGNKSASPSHASTIQGKTILITGGAGFIGSSLAEKLAPANRIILLDQNLLGGPIKFTSLLSHPNVRAVEGNLLDGIDLRGLGQEADIVIHAAAIVGVNRVCNFGRQTLETNFVGTSRLLKALESSRRLQRFVYFSTSEVFGVNSFRVDENSPPSVGPIAEARWSYAIAKLAGEHLVKSYYRELQMPTVIVRPFNIFGPRRTGDHALLRFILNALTGQPIEIHGDGSQIRSWCYIEDFCQALVEMIARPGVQGEDFNIGHPGNTLTVSQLAYKVMDLTGASVPVKFTKPAFPDISIRVPSLEKARRLLDYEPWYDLDSALTLTIDWYRENLDSFVERAMAVGSGR
jgi:nucleoside-diphosphate-sugar epimerase